MTEVIALLRAIALVLCYIASKVGDVDEVTDILEKLKNEENEGE